MGPGFATMIHQAARDSKKTGNLSVAMLHGIGSLCAMDVTALRLHCHGGQGRVGSCRGVREGYKSIIIEL